MSAVSRQDDNGKIDTPEIEPTRLDLFSQFL
jgi:hypothetical protein